MPAPLFALPPNNIGELRCTFRGFVEVERAETLWALKERTAEQKGSLRDWILALLQRGPTNARTINQLLFQVRGVRIPECTALFDADDHMDSIVSCCGWFPFHISAQKYADKKRAAGLAGKDLQHHCARSPPYCVRGGVGEPGTPVQSKAATATTAHTDRE